MAKTIKSLLRISMVIRNLGTLNNCSITKRFIQTSTNCCTNYNKETLVSPQPHLLNTYNNSAPQTTSSLQSLLKNSESTTEIFRLIQENTDKISGTDAVIALEALFTVDKNSSEKITKIYERSEFLRLCEILKKNIRHLNTNEGISTLKTLIYFNVPTSSIIVQLMLQMLRHSVNHLSLQQIGFVDFLLTKCQRTPLGEALTIALPIVYETNVSMKLDRENIQSLSTSLKYLSRKSSNAYVFTVILAAIKECKQPIDPLSAKSILWSLCDLKCFPEGLTDVISIVQNVMAQNINSLNRQTIKTVLGLISDKVRLREPHFYHEGFADACASIVVTEDWGFADAVYVLDRLLMLGHMQISLLDYIAIKCFEDPTLLENETPANIATIVAGFSTADYKPVFWDVIQDAVTSDKMIDAKYMNYPISKLAVHLISLDCYCPKLLKRIFGHYHDTNVSKKIERGRLLSLYQAVKTLYPQYDGPWPRQDVEHFIPHTLKSSYDDFPLLGYLECALGGRRYVITNVRSQLGHLIDHVVVMRKGGFPIAINNAIADTDDEYDTFMMENLSPPPDGQVILIIYMPGYAYSVNSERMKGVWSLRIKSLEALSGYTVIPIQSMMWKNLPESERIPYLMQAIRLKCDEVSMSINS